MSTISNSQSHIHTGKQGHASRKWEGLQRYPSDDNYQRYFDFFEPYTGSLLPVYLKKKSFQSIPHLFQRSSPHTRFFKHTVKHVRGV